MVSDVIHFPMHLILLVNDNSFTAVNTDTVESDSEVLFVFTFVLIVSWKRGCVSFQNILHFDSGGYSLDCVFEDNDEVVGLGRDEDSTSVVEDWEAELSHSDDDTGHMNNTPFSCG